LTGRRSVFGGQDAWCAKTTGSARTHRGMRLARPFRRCRDPSPQIPARIRVIWRVRDAHSSSSVSNKTSAPAHGSACCSARTAAASTSTRTDPANCW